MTALVIPAGMFTVDAATVQLGSEKNDAEVSGAAVSITNRELPLTAGLPEASTICSPTTSEQAPSITRCAGEVIATRAGAPAMICSTWLVPLRPDDGSGVAVMTEGPAAAPLNQKLAVLDCAASGVE